MAATGGLICFTECFLFVGISMLCIGCCTGELFITHSPSHTQFLQNAGSLDLSELPKIVVSSFGLGLEKDLKWNGMSQGNVFKRPKAHCVVSVEGVQDGMVKPESIATYQVNNDVGAVNTDMVRHRLSNAAKEGSFVLDFSQYSRIYDARNEYPELLKDVPSNFANIRAIFAKGEAEIMSKNVGCLNISQEADLAFLAEMLMLRSVVNALKSNPGVARDSHPDFMHFKVMTIEGLIKEYGQQSAKVEDALIMLEDILDEMTRNLRELYRDNVVVEVVTFVNDSPDILHRNVRSLMAAEKANKTIQETLNVASRYSDNYAVFFNLILWLVVVLVLTLLFISYGIWFMDPGKDSIIYRMTSQRLKRE